MGGGKCDTAGTLLTATMAMLKNDTGSLISLSTASGLPFYWLKDMKAGRIKSPSVNRVQALYEFYTQAPLFPVLN